MDAEERWSRAEDDWREALELADEAGARSVIDSEIRGADEALMSVALARRPEALRRLEEIFSPTMVRIIESGPPIETGDVVVLAIEANAPELHWHAERVRRAVSELDPDA